MVRDIQAMAARASQGFAQERSFRGRGWRPPPLAPAPPWPRVERGSSAMPGVEDAFAMIPGARFAVLPEAGLLVYHAHPEAVAELFADHAGTEIAA